MDNTGNEKINQERRKRDRLLDFKKGFTQGYELTSEDRRDYLQFIRDVEGKAEAPRAQMTFIQHPGVEAIRQAQAAGDIPKVLPDITDQSLLYRANYGLNVGPQMAFDIPQIDPVNDDPIQTAKKRRDIERKATKYREQLKQIPLSQKLGYAVGSLGSDLTQDSTRNLWWLLNAAQAVGNISSEYLTNVINPELFDKQRYGLREAEDQGLIKYQEPNDSDFNPDFETKKDWDERQRNNINNYSRMKPGVKISKKPGDTMPIGRRRFNQNAVALATTLPIGIAINQGVGLIGRREGYAATVPDQDDERKSANLLAEVASRYFLGREGRLLDQNAFLMERPDSTASEYQQYKAYLRDREIDLNPFDDGKINLGGVLKTNPDGIRGAEVSFLGKSLPVNDTLIPALSALAGTAAGAYLPKRLGMKNKAAVLGAVFGGGIAGLTAGNVVGNSMEAERRRRNFEENYPRVDYDRYRQSAAENLEAYNQRIANYDPVKKEAERGESKTGFNKRQYQDTLLQRQQVQQALISEMIDEEQKRRAIAANAQVTEAAKKFNEIEQSIQ